MLSRLPVLVAGVIFVLSASQAAGTEPPPAPAVAADPFTAMDSDGHSIALLSVEGYRAEFRHLRRVWHGTDLKGPPVETDGWTHHIPEAEWPWMGFSYFGYACANLARWDPGLRDDALAEMRWLIEAMQTKRMSGFITRHLGEPFGTDEIHPSTFVHGHWLNLAMRYREVSGDVRYNGMIHRVAEALVRDYERTDQGILRSYKDMWWITDNGPSLSALARYDRVFKRDSSAVRKKFVASTMAHYLDPRTGMFATYVDPEHHRVIQGPRGISVFYGLHFFRDCDEEFAARHYALAKKHLIRDILGFTAAREFPEGVEGNADVDSGPLVGGMGPSASGFAIAAAAVQGDAETARRMIAASAVVGVPVFEKGELRYSLMPPVGQSVILFGKTQLLGTKK